MAGSGERRMKSYALDALDGPKGDNTVDGQNPALPITRNIP